MENPLSRFVGATRAGSSLDGIAPAEGWRQARAAQMDLQVVQRQRLNLLLVGNDEVLQSILELLFPGLPPPIISWCRGAQLVLPPPTQGGTLILHDVGALAPEDQAHLLDWSERAVGRVQIVSTTTTPLLTRVESGTFLDRLYYRLNTVCVEVSLSTPQ